MSKPTLLFRGPVKTLSGYGSHSRDLLKSLFDMDLFNIYIDSSNWGSTPMTALEPETNLFHLWIEENVISQSISQPDIYVQVTVPNEFQRIGKYNIGITAGIETTVAAKSWIDGCNRMDKVITTSTFSRDVLLQTVYNENDKVWVSGIPSDQEAYEYWVEIFSVFNFNFLATNSSTLGSIVL